MRASFKILGLILILFLSGKTFAEEKSKVVKRSFKVSPSTLIEIDNRFGKVHVNTWDKNEVNVNIEILAEGSDPDRILERIDIEFKEENSDNYLGIFTTIKEFNERRSSFSINYTVDLPKNNKLKVRNKFGDVYLAEMNSDLDLNVQYGNLKAEKLNGNVNLDLEFGSAMNHIAFIKSGVVNIKYSKLTIDRSGPLNIDSQFSDVLGTDISQATLEMKYGKFIVDNLGKISGSQSFSEFRVGTLSGNINLEIKHNQVIVEKVKSNVKLINVEGQFSKIEFGLENNYAAKFEMNFQFADLKYDGEGIIFRKRLREPTKNYYEGYIGSESATSSLVVNSKYGDLKLDIGR